MRKKLLTDVKSFASAIPALSHTENTASIWSDFINACACTISNAVDKARFQERERVYMNIAKRYGSAGMTEMAYLFACVVQALDENPAQDFLGSVYSLLRLQ